MANTGRGIHEELKTKLVEVTGEFLHGPDIHMGPVQNAVSRNQSPGWAWILWESRKQSTNSAATYIERMSQVLAAETVLEHTYWTTWEKATPIKLKREHCSKPQRSPQRWLETAGHKSKLKEQWPQRTMVLKKSSPKEGAAGEQELKTQQTTE